MSGPHRGSQFVASEQLGREGKADAATGRDVVGVGAGQEAIRCPGMKLV